MMDPENKGVSEKRYHVGILTAPAEHASIAPISNLINILKPISKSLVIITGNASYHYLKSDTGILVFDNSHPIEKNCAKKLINYLHAQIKGSVILFQQRKTVEVWFFFMGGEREFFPILIAKLLKKTTFLVLTGSIVKSAIYAYDPFLAPIKILNWITCNLVRGLILYSPDFLTETGLRLNKNKVFYAHEHFLNLTMFRVQTPLDKRSCIIGYIGRLSGEKGIINFVESLPEILDKQKEVRVIIGGDGPLKVEIETYLENNGLNDEVNLTGWISHEDLPEYLNRLQLLIIPSYTEGLPNILLESMACGTPVLVTPVGMIPDIIKDGVNGFIMENNSPVCIGENVIRALSSPDLKRIADKGQRFVVSNYSFEKTVENWEKILQKIE